MQAVLRTRLAAAVELRCGRRKVGHAHVDGNLAITGDPRLDEPAGAVHAQRAVCAAALQTQQLCDASGAIAALFDLMAVGVEDAVVGDRACAARRLDDQCLIKAYAAMTVG